METYQAMATALNIIIYRNGAEVEKFDRGPHQSAKAMTGLLAHLGYEVISDWSPRKVGDDMVFFATLRK